MKQKLGCAATPTAIASASSRGKLAMFAVPYLPPGSLVRRPSRPALAGLRRRAHIRPSFSSHRVLYYVQIMACWCDELMESVTSAVTGIKDVSSPAHVIFGLVVLVGTVKLVWSTLTCTLAFLAGLLPKKSLRSYGSWAVITGATDGIGFGMFGRPPIVLSGTARGWQPGSDVPHR